MNEKKKSEEKKNLNLIKYFRIFISICWFPYSNSNGSCQKRGVKCHFTILNSVLTPLNSAFPPMIGAKMGCHFNNSIFFY